MANNWILNMMKKTEEIKRQISGAKSKTPELPKSDSQESRKELFITQDKSPADWIKDTVSADKEKQVKILSDFNLAEKVTELSLAKKGLATNNEEWCALFPKVKKQVESNRKKMEGTLLKLLKGDYSILEEMSEGDGLPQALKEYEEGRKIISTLKNNQIVGVEGIQVDVDNMDELDEIEQEQNKKASTACPTCGSKEVGKLVIDKPENKMAFCKECGFQFLPSTEVLSKEAVSRNETRLQILNDESKYIAYRAWLKKNNLDLRDEDEVGLDKYISELIGKEADKTVKVVKQEPVVEPDISGVEKSAGVSVLQIGKEYTLEELKALNYDVKATLDSKEEFIIMDVSGQNQYNAQLVSENKYKIESAKDIPSNTERDIEYFIEHLKSAEYYLSTYGEATYNLKDWDEAEKQQANAFEGGSDTRENDFVQKLIIRMDLPADVQDALWDTADVGNIEFVEGDNTYNWGYLAPNMNIKLYKNQRTNEYYLIASQHLGGDIRGNYGEGYVFIGSDKGALYERFSNLVYGITIAKLSFDDGAHIEYDGEVSDINNFEINSSSGTGIAKEFESFLPKRGSDRDELILKLVEQDTGKKNPTPPTSPTKKADKTVKVVKQVEWIDESGKKHTKVKETVSVVPDKVKSSEETSIEKVDLPVEEVVEPVIEKKSADKSKKQADAVSQAGDGKTPNLYWVSYGNEWLRYSEETGAYEWIGEFDKNFKSTGKTIEPPFKTFAGAKAKYDELVSEMTEPLDTGGIHTVSIEDRLSGQIYEAVYFEKTMPSYSLEEHDTTKYTKDKLGPDFKAASKLTTYTLKQSGKGNAYECPACNGTGWDVTNNDECVECKGEGKLENLELEGDLNSLPEKINEGGNGLAASKKQAYLASPSMYRRLQELKKQYEKAEKSERGDIKVEMDHLESLIQQSELEQALNQIMFGIGGKQYPKEFLDLLKEYAGGSMRAVDSKLTSQQVSDILEDYNYHTPLAALTMIDEGKVEEGIAHLKEKVEGDKKNPFKSASKKPTDKEARKLRIENALKNKQPITKKALKESPWKIMKDEVTGKDIIVATEAKDKYLTEEGKKHIVKKASVNDISNDPQLKHLHKEITEVTEKAEIGPAGHVNPNDQAKIDHLVSLYEKRMKLLKDIHKSATKKVATGEMSQRDIEEGGEHYEWAKAVQEAVEELAKLTNGKVVFEKMMPFDVYQGPFAIVKINGKADKIWAGMGDEEDPSQDYLHIDNLDIVGTIDYLAEKINEGGNGLAASKKEAADHKDVKLTIDWDTFSEESHKHLSPKSVGLPTEIYISQEAYDDFLLQEEEGNDSAIADALIDEYGYAVNNVNVEVLNKGKKKASKTATQIDTPTKIKVGDKVSFDSYNVKQYENERVVDHEAEVLKIYVHTFLVHSPKLSADVLVPISDTTLNEQKKADQNLYDTIEHGDKVTFTKPGGIKSNPTKTVRDGVVYVKYNEEREVSEVTGTAYIKGPAGWVCKGKGRAMPIGIAGPDNVVKVEKADKPGSKLITDEQKAVVKPEWDKMQEFISEKDKELSENKSASTSKKAGEVLHTEVLPNKNLKVTFQGEKPELVTEGENSHVPFEEAFEYLLQNGYSMVSPEDVGALTDSPIFGEVEYADNGDLEKIDTLYWYPNYGLTDPYVELIQNGFVIFDNANIDAPKFALLKEAGHEIWETPSTGKFWLLNTIVMQSESPLFNTKEEAIKYAVEKGYWNEQGAERARQQDVGGVSEPM